MIERKDITEEIKSFRNRMNANDKSLSVLDKDCVRDYAILSAYRDMQLRTIKGHKMSYTDELRETLAQEFVKYFQSPSPTTREDFDKIHKGLCEGFLNGLNEVFARYKLAKQEFGKAQKVINMTFKYLYCFDDAEKFEDYFRFCHMPIDSYTLNWCFDNIYPKAKNKNWSSLDEDIYDKLSKEIGKNLAFPLKEEFKIWPKEIAKSKETEFIKSIIDFIAGNYDEYNSKNEFRSVDKERIKTIVKNKVAAVNRDRRKDNDADKGIDKEKAKAMIDAIIKSQLFDEIKNSLN
ncbi:MAG: hypothetical protein MR844_02435 [Clostridia bacterium]|nr:hypothetical protein [Clostridia bacterium]